MKKTSAEPEAPTAESEPNAEEASPVRNASGTDATLSACPNDDGSCGCFRETTGSMEFINGAWQCVKCPDGTQMHRHPWDVAPKCYSHSSCETGEIHGSGLCYAQGVNAVWRLVKCNNAGTQTDATEEDAPSESDANITECPTNAGTTDPASCKWSTGTQLTVVDGVYKCASCPDGNFFGYPSKCYTSTQGAFKWLNDKPKCYNCSSGSNLEELGQPSTFSCNSDMIKLDSHGQVMCYTCPDGMPTVTKEHGQAAKCQAAEDEWGIVTCPEGRKRVCASDWASSCDCYDEGTANWRVHKCLRDGVETFLAEVNAVTMNVSSKECPSNPDTQDHHMCGCEHPWHTAMIDGTYQCIQCPDNTDGPGMDPASLTFKCYSRTSCPAGYNLEYMSSVMKCVEQCEGGGRKTETKVASTLNCPEGMILGEFHDFYRCYSCPED